MYAQDRKAAQAFLVVNDSSEESAKSLNAAQSSQTLSHAWKAGLERVIVGSEGLYDCRNVESFNHSLCLGFPAF